MAKDDETVHIKWKTIDPGNPKTWPPIHMRVLVERDDGWIAFLIRSLDDRMFWALYPIKEPVPIERCKRFAVVPKRLNRSLSKWRVL